MNHIDTLTASTSLLEALECSDTAWVLTDAHGHTTHASAGVTHLLGWGAAHLLGQPLLQVLLGAQHAELTALSCELTQALEREGRFARDVQVQRHGGGTLWVMLTANTIAPASASHTAAVGCIWALTDITHIKCIEALQKHTLHDVANARPLAPLLHGLCTEVERLDPTLSAAVLQVDDDGRLHLQACPSVPREALAQLENMRIGAHDGPCGQAAFTGQSVICADLRTARQLQSMHQHLLRAGLQGCMATPIFNSEQQVVGVFALYLQHAGGPNALQQQLAQTCAHLCNVAMERSRSRERIHQLAHYDALTQLPNRSMFQSNASDALHAAQGRTSALLFVDLDRFKLVNDSQGHAAGDALLCEVARRIRASARPGDVLGRLSSDEFSLLLPGCSGAEAEQVAKRLLERIAEPFTIGNTINIPHASVGICTYPEDGTDIHTLLRHADQAMYVAKQQGRQRWQRFTPVINQFTQDRVSMEHALREALSNGQLQLHYQPQVLAAQIDQLYGVEALTRWHHPQWGYVSPMRFIAVAEDAGMIQELTTWLLETACAQLAAWRAEGVAVPQVAVNLSTKNFHAPHFAQQVADVLGRHGLTAKDLVLEITESVMLDASPATLANLEELHHLGLQLSLDDFGTGYSSLSYLHRLPISEIKLDKSFVQDLSNSVAAEALIRSVLSIARSLHMQVVAEGVETVEQRQWLQLQGCPVLQGYLFCKPVPPDVLVASLRQQSFRLEHDAPPPIPDSSSA